MVFGEGGRRGRAQGEGRTEHGGHERTDAGVREAIDDAAGARIRDFRKGELRGVVGGEVAPHMRFGRDVVFFRVGQLGVEVSRHEVRDAEEKRHEPRKAEGAEEGGGKSGGEAGGRGEEPSEAEGVDHCAEGQRIHVARGGKIGAGAASVGGGEELYEDPAAEGGDGLGEVHGGRRTEVRPAPEDGHGDEEPREPEDDREPVVAAGDGPLQAVEQGEDEIVKRFHLHVRVVVDLDARGRADGDEGGAEREGGPHGAGGGIATEDTEGDDDDDDRGGEETGAHRQEGERGGGCAEPPAHGKRSGERERDDGGEGRDEQPVLLRMKTAEDVLPSEREAEKGDGEEPEGGEKERGWSGERGRRGEGETGRGADEADGEEPEGGGEGAVENSVGDGLEAGVPLAVEDGEGEVLEFGENDAVLVVGGKDVLEEVVVFVPRDDGVVCLGVPLIPVGHGRAEAVEGRPLQAEDDAEEASRVDADAEVRTQECEDHGRRGSEARLRIRGDGEEVVVQRSAFDGAQRIRCVET